jgi:hypothetical protein
MDKEIYQDVFWLFHDLGRHVRPLVSEAPEERDTRNLLRVLIQHHQPTIVGGRNPFNWLKELQTVSNFWHHIPPDSDIPEDDIWRDLDTLERVAMYLGFSPDFTEDVRGAKEKIWADKKMEDRCSIEADLRSWIREEVGRQLKAPDLPGVSGIAETGDGTGQNSGGTSPGRHRGDIAEHVRDFVIATYIEPARAEGQKKVSVRAGDVDKALGYRYRRLPLVCAALKSQKFLEAARARLVDATGPPSGASTTTTFLYELE